MFDLFDAAEACEPTSSQEGSHAKTFRWLDDVLALLESGAVSGTNSIGSSGSSLPPGFSLKTSLVFSAVTPAPTLPSSFEGWGSWGMGGPTGFVTLNGGAFPRDASVCSLSDVTETSGVPHKFFLTRKACLGILRRAEKRGVKLPQHLQQALRAVAESIDPDDGEKTTPTSSPTD